MQVRCRRERAGSIRFPGQASGYRVLALVHFLHVNLKNTICYPNILPTGSQPYCKIIPSCYLVSCNFKIAVLPSNSLKH